MSSRFAIFIAVLAASASTQAIAQSDPPAVMGPMIAAIARGDGSALDTLSNGFIALVRSEKPTLDYDEIAGQQVVEMLKGCRAAHQREPIAGPGQAAWASSVWYCDGQYFPDDKCRIVAYNLVARPQVDRNYFLAVYKNDALLMDMTLRDANGCGPITFAPPSPPSAEAQ